MMKAFFLSALLGASCSSIMQNQLSACSQPMALALRHRRALGNNSRSRREALSPPPKPSKDDVEDEVEEDVERSDGHTKKGMSNKMETRSAKKKIAPASQPTATASSSSSAEQNSAAESESDSLSGGGSGGSGGGSMPPPQPVGDDASSGAFSLRESLSGLRSSASQSLSGLRSSASKGVTVLRESISDNQTPLAAASSLAVAVAGVAHANGYPPRASLVAGGAVFAGGRGAIEPEGKGIFERKFFFARGQLCSSGETHSRQFVK